jgi:hypothetical protein
LLFRKQHGRYIVTRSIIDRELISIDNTALTITGFLIDKIDIIKESIFFASNNSIRESSKRQIKSLSAASQAEGQEIERSLDRDNKTSNHILLEITTRLDNPLSLIFLELQYRTQILYKIDKLYHRKFLNISRILDSEK